MASSMFKKPKRNFRRKGIDFDNNDNENAENESKEESMEVDDAPKITPTPEAVKKKKEKGPKDASHSHSRGSSKSKLSFGMDEEEDVGGETEIFKVKKSSHSRRIAKQMRREKKEREKELAKNGNTKHTVDSDSEKEPDEDGDRKKETSSSRKKRAEDEAKAEEKLRLLREEFRTLNGEEAEAIDGDSDDDGQKAFKAKLARGEIPDAKTIHFIRKQRQMARDTDFIPVSESESQVKTKSSTSRLVRDDDNDKSDEEEDDRVDFSVDKGARERQQIRDEFLAAEHGSDEDSDQEREWEKQQIRKAVSLQIPGLESQTNSNSNDGSSVSFFSSSPQRTTSSSANREFKPLSALSKSHNTSDITIESVRKRLQERLTTMDTVYRSHKMDLDRVSHDLEDSKDNIESCKLNSPGLENRYRFFQELRGCPSSQTWSRE